MDQLLCDQAPSYELSELKRVALSKIIPTTLGKIQSVKNKPVVLKSISMTMLDELVNYILKSHINLKKLKLP